MGHAAVGRGAAACCELLEVVACWGEWRACIQMVVSVTMGIEVPREIKIQR